MAFQDWINCSAATLDENISYVNKKPMEIIKFSCKLNLYVLTNEIEAERKIVDLLQENEINVSITPADQKKFDLERERKLSRVKWLTTM